MAAVAPSQSRIGPIWPPPSFVSPPTSETASATRPSTESDTPTTSTRTSRRLCMRAEAKASTPIPPAEMLWTSESGARASAAT